MSVYRDPKNKKRWVAEVPTGRLTPSGRPAMTRRSAPTRADAERLERELKTQRDKGLPLPHADLTVGAYLTSWVTQMNNSSLADATKISYSQIVRDYLIPRLGTIKLKDLHQRHVQQLQDTLLTYRAAHTVRVVKRTLSVALNEAMRHDLVSRNVVTLTTAVTVPKRRELRIAPEQISTFLDAIHGHLHEDLFLFLLHTGVRRGEACGLQWKHLHLDDTPASVTINHSYSRTRTGFTLTTPKTQSSVRTIALSDTITSRLQMRRDRIMTRDHHTDDTLADEFVFAGILGHPPHPDTITTQLRQAMDTAGLAGVGPHQLRHLFTTLLLSSTDNVTAVSHHLGHANIRTTIDIYGHHSHTLMSSIAPLIDNAIKEKTQK